MKHMKKILTVAAVCAASSSFADSGSFSTPRIVNGVDANLSEWPFLVSLQDDTSFHFCGGAYIGNNIVITAAHCIDTTIEKPVDHIGFDNTAVDLQSNVSVGRYWVHPDYDDSTLANDIAAIQITGDVSGLTVIPLADTTVFSALTTGDELDVAGWGYIDNDENTPTVLQETNQRLEADSKCESNYDGYDDSVSICAGDFEQDTVPADVSDSCQGDSGGPLISRKGGTDVLVGIVSYGADSCAAVGIPGVYTKVAAYDSTMLLSLFDTNITITPEDDYTFDDIFYSNGTSLLTDDNQSVKTMTITNNDSSDINFESVFAIPSINASDSITTIDSDCDAKSPLAQNESCTVTFNIDTAKMHTVAFTFTIRF